MTNKEILGADLLDILFENRNKAYGAYALRKNYNHRLQWALGIWLMLVLCLSLLNFSAENLDNRAHSRPDVVLQTVDLSNDKPKIPQTPQQKKKKVPPKRSTTPEKKKHRLQFVSPSTSSPLHKCNLFQPPTLLRSTNAICFNYLLFSAP